jgi:hypothetical protein
MLKQDFIVKLLNNWTINSECSPPDVFEHLEHDLDLVVQTESDLLEEKFLETELSKFKEYVEKKELKNLEIPEWLIGEYIAQRPKNDINDFF